MGAVVVTGIIGEYIDGVVILFTVIINTLLGYIQENKAKNAVDELKKLQKHQAHVVRNGKNEFVLSSEVVPGDVLVLEAGQVVVADARLIVSYEIKLNESALTGESFPAEKNTLDIAVPSVIQDQHNMVFSGTSVVNGAGRAIVVATGKMSEIGKIAHDVSTVEKQQTPLTVQFNTLSKFLVAIVFTFSVGFFIFGVMSHIPVYDMFLLALTLSVSVIPEGLAIAVTISLAVGMFRMASAQAVVKTLPAVESLGSVTVVAIDKTGTLTKNELSLTSIVTKVSSDGVANLTGAIEPNVKVPLWERFSQVLVFANGANGASPAGLDPIDGANVMWLKSKKIDIGEVLNQRTIVDALPFSSEKQFEAVMTLHKTMHVDQRVIYLKGSPEAVLSFCSHEQLDESIIIMQSNTQNEIRLISRNMAETGLKPLAIAYALCDENFGDLAYESLPQKFVFVGLLGYADTLRPEAKESVTKAYQGGIRVVMLTGDHRETASEIARQVGINNPKDVVEGKEIDFFTDSQLRDKLKTCNVFARVTPAHKLRIVKIFQEQGEIVAMTGDGVNDAPALSQADIGVSMGKGGTDVARGASDVVLLDNNFATIIAAIAEGRSIFDNVKKVVIYLMSTNVGKLFLMVGALVLGLPFPLYPTQILWLNVVTDGFPDTALVFEPKGKDILKRVPRKRGAFILSRNDVLWIITQGIEMALLAGIVFYVTLPEKGLEYARTMALMTAAFSQLANAISVKAGNRPLWKVSLLDNVWFVAALVVSVLLQFSVIGIPLLREVFRTTSLSMNDILLCVAVSSLVLVFAEFAKILIWITKKHEAH